MAHRLDMAGHFVEDRPEFVGFEFHSDEEWNLSDDDHQADRRQHALDGRGREDGARGAPIFNSARITWSMPVRAIATRAGDISRQVTGMLSCLGQWACPRRSCG